ncbi:MAG: ATP-dependent DNA helicase [Elusimicrobia bacterium]|nr:ATP-dependent DNA helicase [Elusimicrobiota bacterium]
MPPELQRFFSANGLLAASVRNFEPRTQQTDMAGLMARALDEKRHLVVEAGTGIGKSLAYLVPAALWCLKEKKKTVVATYTKALQEQLLKKDMPLLASALGQLGLKLNYHLLMGSENYLCLRRLEKAAKRGPELFADGSSPAQMMQQLLDWAGASETAMRNDAPFKIPEYVWEEVRRESDLCLHAKCPHRAACPYARELDKARRADILIANQHLFFSGMPLKHFDAVIFDEAHNLEEASSRFLGFSLSDTALTRTLERIFNPSTSRGLLTRLPQDNPDLREELEQAVSSALFEVDPFFSAIRRNVGMETAQQLRESAEKRVIAPCAAEDALSPKLSLTAALLGMAAEDLEDEGEAAEVNAFRFRCLEAASKIKRFLACDTSASAFWVSVTFRRRGLSTAINSAPVEVAQPLKKALFDSYGTVALTSATLAIEGSLDSYKSGIGLSNCLEAVLDSPFDYKRQAAVYISEKTADPKENPSRYEETVISEIQDIIRAVPDGGVFALFTSRALLEKTYRSLSASGPRRRLYRQGEMPPLQLLREFKKDGNAVLLGTDTFWQGVDVQGKALSCVIITRLPFMSPSDPLEEARQEHLALEGKNAFNCYSLPRAVIKFRQGFGRLIRSSQDRGAVAILDPRVRTKFYGPAFLYSIPKCGAARSMAELERFFSQGK